MKNRKSIQVTPYALAEVIDALTNDPEHFADIVVTKENGHLIVMFNSTIEDCKYLNEGLLGKILPKKDKPINYPIPKHGDPVLCDIKGKIKMSIDEMIETLQSFKDKLGSGKEEVPVVRINYGENDYFIPSFGLVGDFTDQDNNEFKCALIANIGGEEFTEKGTYHWKWKPKKND